jgi:short-subunit dehydrogenase
MSSLSTKLVVVTGATGGIGAALCRSLLDRGARVLAVARQETALAALRAEAGDRPLVALAADVTDEADRVRIASEALRLGGASVLVHAAGGGGFGLFASGRTDTSALFAVNTLAPIALTRAMLPQLDRRDDAAVVAIGSTFGSLGFPGFADYSASKFALRGWMEAMGREYADRRLRFQWLSPRATDTAFNPAAVQSLNRRLATAVDTPAAVAAQLVEAIEGGRRRLQIGWPEKLFVRINGLLPELVDRALRSKLSAVREADAAASSVPL